MENPFIILWDKFQLTSDPDFDMDFKSLDNPLIDYKELAIEKWIIPTYNSNIHLKNNFTGFVKTIPGLNFFSDFLFPVDLMYISKGKLIFAQGTQKNPNCVVQAYSNKNVSLIENYSFIENSINDKNNDVLLTYDDYFLTYRCKNFNYKLNDIIDLEINHDFQGNIMILLYNMPKNKYGLFSNSKGDLIFGSNIYCSLNELDISNSKEKIFNTLKDEKSLLKLLEDKYVTFQVIKNDFGNSRYYNPDLPSVRIIEKKYKFNFAYNKLLNFYN
jgi:hypothetical protein